METKVCSKCGVEKELGAYGVDRSRPDGRRGVCAECRGAGKAARAAGPELVVVEPVAVEPVAMEPHKACSKCGASKPVAEYPVDKSRKDGHRGVCRPCMDAVDRARAVRQLAAKAG